MHECACVRDRDVRLDSTSVKYVTSCTEGEGQCANSKFTHTIDGATI